MSTRISDLPETGMMMPVQTPIVIDNRSQNTRGSIEGDVQNTYIPMNIHPNPYGNPVAPTSVEHPSMRNETLSKDVRNLLEKTPMQQLPSRDIRMDTADYMQDMETIPNYIPPSKVKNDYVKDHEEVVQETFDKYRREKVRESRLDMIITELQVPVMIGLLYFIFQLPFITNVLNKYLPFITLYTNDGNLNFNGLLIKSILFGGVYYVATQVIDYLTII
jgi:hypothetical protein